MAIIRYGNNMKITILNDTFSWYHWGCTGTSSAIRQELLSRGYDISIISIQELYACKFAPNDIDQFNSETFFNDFEKSHSPIIEKIKGSDIVFINGEGCMHGLRKISLIILYMAYISKKRFEKQVHMVNHSLFPTNETNDANLANTLYKMVYENIDYVAVREIESLQRARTLGIDAKLSFDCLPLYIKSYYSSTNTKSENIVLAGSALFNESNALEYIRFIKHLYSEGMKLTYLTGALDNPSKDDSKFIQKLKEHVPLIEIMSASSLDEWLRIIDEARMLISGRFHHTIAAICLGTPFILLNSNTEKNHGLMKMIAASPPLDINSENLFKELMIRMKVTLKKEKEIEDLKEMRLNELCRLALINFNGLL